MAATKPLVSYDETVMEQLFKRGDWRGWDDCLNWLEQQDSPLEVTDEQVKCLVSNLKQLRLKGVAFPQDYREAYGLVSEHCSS